MNGDIALASGIHPQGDSCEACVRGERVQTGSRAGRASAAEAPCWVLPEITVHRGMCACLRLCVQANGLAVGKHAPPTLLSLCTTPKTVLDTARVPSTFDLMLHRWRCLPRGRLITGGQSTGAEPLAMHARTSLRAPECARTMHHATCSFLLYRCLTSVLPATRILVCRCAMLHHFRLELHSSESFFQSTACTCTRSRSRSV